MKKQLFSCILLVLGSSLSYAQTCDNQVPHTAPDSRYQVLGNGSEVLDKQTNLIWQRCSIGQTWNSTTCEGSSTTHTWANALKLIHDKVANKELGTGYRLPNIKELQSLVEEACYSPSINSTFFPNTPNDNFWSSSPHAYYDYYAWYVNFHNGYSSNYYKYSNYYVRVVRSSQ